MESRHAQTVTQGFIPNSIKDSAFAKVLTIELEQRVWPRNAVTGSRQNHSNAMTITLLIMTDAQAFAKFSRIMFVSTILQYRLIPSVILTDRSL